MRHFLTSLLALHWAVAFALLTVACMIGQRPDASLAMALLGVSAEPAGALQGAPLAAFLSVAFAMVALLFAWMLVAALVAEDADGEPIARRAFAGAAGVLSLVLIVGAAEGASGALPAVAVTLAALMGSYLAVRAEHRAVAERQPAEGDDVRSAARMMAAEAAHNSMLTRLTGRADLTPDGGR